MSNEISVEVAYALPDKQTILTVRVATDATVAQAIERSGILNKFPELDPASLKVGIYGKAVKLDNALRDRDRVEIYRPLIADPKVARKKRTEGEEAKKEEAAEAA